MCAKAKGRDLLPEEASGLQQMLVAWGQESGLASFHFLQSLLDAIPNPVFYKDTSGIYRGCNRAFADLVLGLPREQIVGHTAYDFPQVVPPEVAVAYHTRDLDLIRNPGTQRYEAPVRYADGVEHRVTFNKATIADLEGHVVGMVGIMLDVTDRWRAEAQGEELLHQTQDALAEAEALYQLSSLVGGFADLPGLLQMVVRQSVSLLQADWASVALFDMEARQVTHYFQDGPKAPEVAWPSFAVLWEGARGWALREQRPLLLLQGEMSPLEDEATYQARLAQNIGGCIIAPLRYQESVLGVVTVVNVLKGADFTQKDMELLSALANQVAIVVYNTRIFDELQRRAERMEAAAIVAEAAASILGLDELLPMAVDLIKEKFHLYYVGIFLVDQERHWVGLRAGTGEPGRIMLANQHGFEIGSNSMIGQCVALGVPQIPERIEAAVRYVNPLLPDSTAEIALPLIGRGQIIGAMTVQSDKVRSFSRTDITVLQTMAGQIATAIQNARVFDEAQASLAETQALYKVSRGVNQAQSVQDLVSSVADVAEFLEMDAVSVRLFTHWDEHGNPLMMDAHLIELEGAARNYQCFSRMDFDHELLAWFTGESQKIYVYDDITAPDVEVPESVRASMGQRGYRSVISAALHAANRLLGLLSWLGRRPVRRVSERFLEVIVRTVVDQVGGALYTRHLIEQNERRAQRLQTAAEVSRAASSIVDQDQLLFQAVELIRERFNLYYAGIFLLDDSQHWAVLRAGTGEAGQIMLQAGHRLEVGGKSMIGTCVASGEAVIRLDVGQAAVRFNNPHLPDTRSEMALPLASRGEVIGAMTIQSVEVAAYSPSDITILQTMADQLANAIINARLIAESEARYQEVQRIQSRYTVEMLDTYVVQQGVLGYSYDLEQVTPISSLETVAPLPETWTPEMPVVPTEGGDGASLISPLELKGELVGTLRFEEPGDAAQFSEDDIAMLEAVRDQISLALENRLLLDQSQNALRETRRREQQVRFLQEVVAFLNATENLVAALDDFVIRLSALFPLDMLLLVGYDMRDGASQVLGVGQAAETQGAALWLNRRLPPTSGASWVAQKNQLYVVNDLHPAQQFPEDADWLGLEMTSLVIMPLRLGYRALGSLHLASRTSEAFSRADLMPILEQVAAQVASAMERASLLRQAQDSAGESRRLYEATSALGKATSYETLLRAIIEHTILGESARGEIQLFVPDPETGATHDRVETVTAWSNDPKLRPAEIGERMHISELPILEQVGDEVYVVADVTTDERLPEAARAAYLQQGVLSVVVGQFLIGGIVSGERIGFFKFEFSEKFEPTEQDIRLYNSILVQAAVVISNLELLQRSVNQTEQLSAAVDLANVTTALSDREQLLRDSVNFFRDRFDLYFVAIYLLDSDGVWAVLEAGSGEAGDKLLRMGHRLRVSSETLEGWCAERAQRRVALDVSRDPLYFANPLLPETRSAIALPLVSRGQTIGVLSLQSQRRFAFTQEEISTLDLMATQLANVIESANLYERSQGSLAETRMLYRISQQITDASAVEDVLEAAVDGISQREEPDWISAGLLMPIRNPTELRLVVNRSREQPKLPVQILPLSELRLFLDVLNNDGRFVTPDVTQEPIVDEYVRNFFGGLRLRATAVFPLAVRDVQYGLLLIHSIKTREFSTAELRFYESVARQTSVALQNISLIADTQEEADRRAFLNQVLQTASTELEPVSLMRNVGQVIAAWLHMPVLMWQWDGRFLSPVGVLDGEGVLLNADREPGTFVPNEFPAVYEVVDSRETAHIDFRGRKDSLMLSFTAGLKSPLVEAYAVRLAVREAVFGVLMVGRQEGQPPIDEKVRETIRTAGINISVALETAGLYQDAQGTAEKLKEVDRLKSEFLANMSHELRTPLNSIIGFSRVILKGIDGPLTDMQKTDLTAIFESGTQLLNLINDILDISKIEAGKMEFAFEPTDLKELIKSVLLVSKALVKDKNVELLADVPPELPSVLADTRRVRQVITNLMSNAAKFTEQGYIKISATYDNYQVIVSVQDTGIGIPQHRFAAVFERFEQVDSSSTRKYGGTGIGMPLSLEFIKAHGGDLWLDSKVGEGSTFFFSLPIGGPQSRTVAPEEIEEKRGKSPTSRIILAVDDDETVITILRRYLEKQGYIVFGLTDSARVMAEARRLKPYAITLDVLMPGKDGWEVIGDLQSEPETREIPVIVCSIKSDDVEKGFSMGASDYLIKPINEQDLLDALTRLDQPIGEGYILVADDNVDDRKLLHRILTNAGHQVREAAGGADAISRIHADPPALIVLDLMMPDVDGFAVLENLKANSTTQRIPVIVVTAKELTREERERLQQGVEALLQKGIYDQEQLLRDVASVLESVKKNGRHRTDKKDSVQSAG